MAEAGGAHRLRQRPVLGLEEDPDFVLNRPEYQQGSILLVGPNFGCGSSREHAVWALEESGFYAVVSSKFADIFRANSLKNGLLPVEIPEETVQAITDLVERDPSTEITIDVAKRTIRVESAGIETGFPLDDFARYRLMNGLDDIGMTMQRQDEISNYESTRPTYQPAINDR